MTAALAPVRFPLLGEQLLDATDEAGSFAAVGPEVHAIAQSAFGLEADRFPFERESRVARRAAQYKLARHVARVDGFGAIQRARAGAEVENPHFLSASAPAVTPGTPDSPPNANVGAAMLALLQETHYLRQRDDAAGRVYGEELAMTAATSLDMHTTTHEAAAYAGAVDRAHVHADRRLPGYRTRTPLETAVAYEAVWDDIDVRLAALSLSRDPNDPDLMTIMEPLAVAAALSRHMDVRLNRTFAEGVANDTSEHESRAVRTMRACKMRIARSGQPSATTAERRCVERLAASASDTSAALAHVAALMCPVPTPSPSTPAASRLLTIAADQTAPLPTAANATVGAAPAPAHTRRTAPAPSSSHRL